MVRSLEWNTLWRPVGVAALALLSNGVVLWGKPGLLAFAATFLLTCLLPGYLLIETILPRRETMDGLERAALSLGAGYASLILGGLVIHYLPSPVTPGLILLIYDAFLLLLLIPYSRRERGSSSAPVPKHVLVQASLVLAVSAFFRLTHLGYAEFQGDEAIIMLKATAAIQGRTDAIFVHKKGPAEILIPTLFYALQGQISEGMARLPFALAMLAGFLALYQLGRATINPFVGLMAGLLLAINGFFVAFGRIVQYQSLVFLTSTLALLCYYRFCQDRPLARRYQFLGTLFLGVGLLAHYDATFVAPALAYLSFRRWRAQPGALRGDLKVWLGTGALCAVLLAAFYVPLVRHPYFRTATLAYLTDVRVGEGFLYNTLSKSFDLSTFYNSTYYMGFLALTLAAEVVRHLRAISRRRVGLLLSLLFIGGSVAVVARPQWWQFGDLNAALFFLAAFLLILLALPSPSTPWKAHWLWFAVPFVFYACLIGSPRTHVHIVFPAWTLLSAVALDRVRASLGSCAGSHACDSAARELPLLGICGLLSLKGARWRWAAALGFAALYLMFGYYIYLVFVRHDVEYKRTYPASKHPLYWAAYDRLPSTGWFGFPYRAGWKVIGALYGQGVLRGDYDSNEEPAITNWYTRGAWRCSESPRYYFIAENVQDERPVPYDVIAAEYEEIGRVTVAGRPRIRIYQRAPAPSFIPPEIGGERGGAIYAVEAYAGYYDRQLSKPTFDPGLPFGDPLAFMEHPLEANLAGRARLLGYSLDSSQVEPGGVLLLTLYWQGVAEMDRDYQVFVHVEAGGRIWGQNDHTPGTCEERHPTSRWRPGQVVVDRSVVPIAPDAPEGRYPLLVGLYDWQTLQRLEVLGPAGQPQGDSVLLGEVTVQRGP